MLIRPAIIALLLATPALAHEPVGCDKFKWALDQERKLLASAAPVSSGAEIAQPLGTAVAIPLAPFADAKLPQPPSRAPKQSGSYAGFVRVPAPPKSGTYRVTLSQGAWIDVIQEGHDVKSVAFSGAHRLRGHPQEREVRTDRRAVHRRADREPDERNCPRHNPGLKLHRLEDQQ